MTTYDWRTLFYPLGAGVNTEPDPRALEAPALAVCKNGEFIEVGGVQTRKPFVSIGTNIKGGGTISNIQKIQDYNGELLAFTTEAVYSWSVADTAWVLKGTHLAAKVTETPVFVNTTEQVMADKCEIGNYAIYAWVKKTSSAELVYVAAIDNATGNVVLQPTNPDDGVDSAATRPRLVPLASNALLFFLDGSDDLKVIDLNIATLAADLATAGTTIAATANGPYDVCRGQSGTNAYVVAAMGASYEVAIISSAAAITANATKALPADGPICIAVPPSSSRVMVGRINTTGTDTVRGDILNLTTLADVNMNTTIGTLVTSGPFNHLTAAYRSAQVGGEWTCYFFWTENEGVTISNISYVTRTNTLNNVGAAGTESTLKTRVSLASRAFDHNGRVYFWGVYAFSANALATLVGDFSPAQLQNSYFLYRDDGFLVAKATNTRAAGFSAETGYLPGVHSTAANTYSWCGGTRRRITITAKAKDYADRSPQDIEVVFNSNEARRCVTLGRTLYMSGGEILQYDGKGLVEVGWHLYPPGLTVGESATAGNIPNGTYTYGSTLAHENSVGELDRSAMVVTTNAVIAAGPKEVDMVLTGALAATHRADGWLEVWRTLVNPVVDAPMRLITSNDPTAAAGNNTYYSNTDSVLLTEDDNYSDTTLRTKEAFDQSGSVLERLAPPAATIIVATHERLFLAGISDNPYQVWYSRQREVDTVAAFHDNLTIEVPPTSGPITGLAFLEGTLIVFCDHGIWALPGDGLDNTGGGNNYGPARLISSDVGAVSHDSITLTPKGIVFQSSKGIYLLGNGLDPIGRPVADFTDTIVAAHVMEDKHQVRFLSSARMLVWDYRVNQWSEWEETGVAACIWNGTHHLASSSTVRAEQSTWGSNVTYALDVETAWIPIGPGGKMGQGKCAWFEVLGEVISAHDLRVRVARNFVSTSSGATFFQSKYWPVSPATVGGPIQVRHAPSIRVVEAIKIRITAYASGSTTNPPTGGACKLTGFTLQVGLGQGLWRMLPAAQKQ